MGEKQQRELTGDLSSPRSGANARARAVLDASLTEQSERAERRRKALRAATSKKKMRLVVRNRWEMAGLGRIDCRGMRIVLPAYMQQELEARLRSASEDLLRSFLERLRNSTPTPPLTDSADPPDLLVDSLTAPHGPDFHTCATSSVRVGVLAA